MKKQFITEAARLQKLAGIITESQINENEESNIVDFLNANLDKLKDVLKRKFPNKSEEIDSAELVDYDGSDVDATLFASRGSDQTVPSGIGVAFQFADQLDDDWVGEGSTDYINIGGKNIAIGTYNL
jgi:hypothetical protein